MHYYVKTQQRMYSVVFLKSAYPQTTDLFICSFAVMVVKDDLERAGGSLQRQRRDEGMATDSEPTAAFWAAQLQAVVKYTERSVRHTYIYRH